MVAFSQEKLNFFTSQTWKKEAINTKTNAIIARKKDPFNRSRIEKKAFTIKSSTMKEITITNIKNYYQTIAW
jgi:predicted alpha-1,6-mannanase (GH76 family)